MASGGKSSGSGSTSSAFGDALAGIAEKINKEVDPVRKMFLGQLQQVLSGNTTTSSSLPLIQSGVRSARDAGGASMADTQRYLAMSGAANSPFAASTLSQVGSSTEQAIGSVPGQVAEGYLDQVSGAVGSIGGQALSGLANAAQTNYNTSNNESNQNYSFLTGLLG